ncbi:myb-binding protein 1A [Eublepharis macularius]|uniref:Myb-binding protein 1A n=1 Tax=Eublepharis macularius TaxID=481883 RepID=A0AA97KL66_EUBMA|nr:myb-binding protein 1A [Eublepharis macularius]
MAGDGGGGEAPALHPGRLLGQNRKFLDFFWDIAKPDQEVRLAATEGLIRYLQENQEDDDALKYTLKRLIDGLAATREASRPGFSLALAQVLQVFEEIPLRTVLEQIQEKHNLGRIKKKLFRNALFGNFFGVLALFQSGRLSKDSKALLGCVQLLQGLSEHHAHLKDLPRKTLADIVAEIPEGVFEEVLFSALEDDLTSALSTPGQLYLLLVGIQKFPGVLHPEKLKDLLGTDAVITSENIPKLVEVLKMAVKSEKKDRTLPSVGLDLMKVALKEGSFEQFWKEVVEDGLLKDNVGPCNYMCYRLLGSALPLLSLSQLKMVLQGEVMRHYGTHVVSTQLPDRFRFAPEMEAYVSSFLEGCSDAEKQLAVMVSFSTLTNQGNPIMPTFWKVVRHLLPAVLLKYISWLKDMFLNPDLDTCVDFATKRQKQNEKKSHVEKSGHNVTRLRKWIIARLVGIVENPQIKREEEFVMDVTRFCFFHAFFETKKPTSEIPETKAVPSVSLNEPSRTAAANSFFSLLQHLSSMPALGDSAKAEDMRKKHLHGLMASGDPWIYAIAQYANVLLSCPKYVKVVTPFSNEAQTAWDRMLQTVEDLRKKEKKTPALKTSAFQHLLLLVGVHLFKLPAECIDLLNDLQNCTKRAFGEKPKKKEAAAAAGGKEEPEWVEVTVEVLLSLLTQSSGLIRKVCKSVFGLIAQHMTKGALQLILDVFDPQQDQDEESAVVVVEETHKKKTSQQKDVGRNGAAKDSSESSCEDDSDDESDEEAENGKTDSEDEKDEEMDENFRHQLMNVLQAGNALGGDDSDEDVDDETMMSLDENLSALFAEQQKRIQAKKDEREKMRKEKILRRDFKIKVLDLVEVFLMKQAENPLVFDIIDPLLLVIEQSLSSEASKQEQDYLRKTADIFTNHLCRSKQYCKNVAPIREELHALLESLVKRACKQSDSSVALYCFSASLYIFRVLRGNLAIEATPLEKKPKNGKRKNTQTSLPSVVGSLDLERVTAAYRDALNLFLTKRNSPLTGSMFLDLFERHPIMCKHLIDTVAKSITAGARQHQQAQACLLLQKALQTRQFRLSITEREWEELIRESTDQVTETLKMVNEFKVKVDQEKVLKCLELLNFLLKTVTQQKLNVDLTDLRGVLQALSQHEGFGKSTRLGNIYWNVMMLLGFSRPAKEKVPDQPKNPSEAEPVKRKKKGFLPASKKRSNRKKVPPNQRQENGAESGSKEAVADGAEAVPARKRKRKRKNKRKRGGGGESQIQALEQQGSPAKKLKLPPGSAKETDSKPVNLKKKKKREKKGRKPARVDGN